MPSRFTPQGSAAIISPLWGRSSAGRAPRSQCGGRGFDPLRLHQMPDADASPSALSFAGGRVHARIRAECTGFAARTTFGFRETVRRAFTCILPRALRSARYNPVLVECPRRDPGSRRLPVAPGQSTRASLLALTCRPIGFPYPSRSPSRRPHMCRQTPSRGTLGNRAAKAKQPINLETCAPWPTIATPI